jgi:L-fuconolactonase
MRIIDTQIHEPSITSAWPELDARQRASIAVEVTLAAMDAVGVHSAVLDGSPTFNQCAFDSHPDRFRFVARPDPGADDVEALIDAAAAAEGVVALRCVLDDWRSGAGTEALRAGHFDRLFAQAARVGLPVFAFINDLTHDLPPVLERFPGLRLIVDHLGLRQPPVFVARARPFERLDDLLALADFEHVAVKFCGAQTLSGDPYPHRDVWPHLRRVVDAFGAARLMWASDFTRLRMVPPGAPWAGLYSDALGFVRDAAALSDDEKQALLGGTAAAWLGRGLTT